MSVEVVAGNPPVIETVDPITVPALVIPPKIVSLNLIVTSPVIDLDVTVKKVPLYIVEPVLIESTSVSGDLYSASLFVEIHPEDLVIQVPYINDELLAYDPKDLEVLDERWMKLYSPLSEVEVKPVPAVPTSDTKRIDSFSSTFGIRIHMADLPPEEAEEILHEDFFKEYRITRIVKRMDIVADVRPFIEIYKSLRKFERDKKLYRVLGGRRRRY